MKTGIVDVGGGLRGVYAAGVFDRCLADGVFFDLAIGVSAGSANAASYLARQQGRNYRFYTEYAFRREYMGARNMFKKRSYVDLNYVYGTLSRSGGESPLDYQTLLDNPAHLLVVATNALTGNPKYFEKSDLGRDNYDIFKASSAIPFVCPPYEIGWTPYYDGALSDPVPIEKAFACGCRKVVVILSRPADTVRRPERDNFFADRIEHSYPLAAKRLRGRARKYNEEVALAKEYASRGQALILAPKCLYGLNTLKRDKMALQQLYRQGQQDAQTIVGFLACNEQ